MESPSFRAFLPLQTDPTSRGLKPYDVFSVICIPFSVNERVVFIQKVGGTNIELGFEAFLYFWLKQVSAS